MNSYWVSKNVFNRRNNNWKSWPDKGIVAGLIDEIGIVELINQKLGVVMNIKLFAGLGIVNCAGLTHRHYI